MGARADRETQASTSTAPTPTERPGHVLVVEDFEPLRWLAREYLEDLGYLVTVAEDASEALAHLDSGAACDVVFSDVRLPGGIDGVELSQRARLLRPGLQVILTSGGALDSLQERVAADVALLSKPYALGALEAAVRRALGR